jgi:hypothetical protein
MFFLDDETLKEVGRFAIEVNEFDEVITTLAEDVIQCAESRVAHLLMDPSAHFSRRLDRSISSVARVREVVGYPLVVCRRLRPTASLHTRLESENTQRDEALDELRVAYLLHHSQFPVVQWEPPGLNGKVGEYYRYAGGAERLRRGKKPRLGKGAFSTVSSFLGMGHLRLQILLQRQNARDRILRDSVRLLSRGLADHDTPGVIATDPVAPGSQESPHLVLDPLGWWRIVGSDTAKEDAHPFPRG